LYDLDRLNDLDRLSVDQDRLVLRLVALDQYRLTLRRRRRPGQRFRSMMSSGCATGREQDRRRTDDYGSLHAIDEGGTSTIAHGVLGRRKCREGREGHLQTSDLLSVPTYRAP
jgi:hypothetical protein